MLHYAFALNSSKCCIKTTASPDNGEQIDASRDIPQRMSKYGRPRRKKSRNMSLEIMTRKAVPNKTECDKTAGRHGANEERKSTKSW
jgi:hypothetical protein